MNLGANAAVGGSQNCLQFSGSAILNPVEYVNGLAEAFVAKGGQIFEETRVRKPDNNKVTTMAGNQVSTLTEPHVSLPHFWAGSSQQLNMYIWPHVQLSMYAYDRCATLVSPRLRVVFTLLCPVLQAGASHVVFKVMDVVRHTVLRIGTNPGVG